MRAALSRLFRRGSRRGSRRLLPALGLLLVAGLARAEGQALEPKLAGRELAEALAEGGYVVLWRHTATEDVAPAPGEHDPDDCATQRNLSAKGRQQAEAAGRAFRALGIGFAKVLSSPYCRCVDTGRLALGEVEIAEVLSTGDGLSPEERSERGARIRALLDRPPEPGTNTLLITHSGPLLYSFGLRLKPEGIAHVFRPTPVGPAAYVGFVLPDEWPALAGPESP